MFSKIDIIEYLGEEVYEPLDEHYVLGDPDQALYMVLMLILPNW